MKDAWGTDFSGRGKIYSCFSADSGFAKALAEALRSQGYKACSYSGYHAEISMGYEKLDLSIPKFKQAFKGNPKDEGVHRWSSSATSIFGRAGGTGIRDPY